MHTITMDPYFYLHRTFGIDLPTDVPTPNELRAISEIHRCRRMHSDLVFISHPTKVSYTVEGFAQYQRSRHILMTTIRHCCEVIRAERKARGL